MKQDKHLSISALIAPIVAANAAAKAIANAAANADGALSLPAAARRSYQVKPDNIKAPGIAVGADGIVFVPGYLSN